MRSLHALALALLATAPTLAVRAQETLPDPATITVPIIPAPADPKVREEGYKFFYFHKPSVSFAEAYADLAECQGLIAGTIFGTGGLLPGFRPWVETPRPPQGYGPGASSLLGSILIPKFERGQRNNKLRRCMEPRGYVRYPLPEAIWDQLNDDKNERALLMQAKLASGPAPQDEKVSE